MRSIYGVNHSPPRDADRKLRIKPSGRWRGRDDNGAGGLALGPLSPHQMRANVNTGWLMIGGTRVLRRCGDVRRKT
ncbi:hypothetical protein KCP71_18810 [Salmonella enterica subsp. enterica]|nr:hypothetical protein KCP71_18810 [Salmonella enterica subsp. enterica]